MLAPVVVLVILVGVYPLRVPDATAASLEALLRPVHAAIDAAGQTASAGPLPLIR